MEGERCIALVTPNTAHRVALRGVRVRSRLSGMSQRTTVEQTFVNREPVPIEAVYTFPLPENAAVCAFEVVTGDRVLTGMVDETDRAIEGYDQAIDRSDAAYLLEQERPDVFTIRVGNLKPRQAATIRLTYVSPLERVDRTIRVTFPTTVAPRYVTASGSDDPLESAIDGDALNPPHALHVPYGLALEVDVDLAGPLVGITSPSHAIRVDENGDGVRRVTLAAGVTEMNRDLVLALELGKDPQPAVQVARGKDGDHFLAVTFLPDFDDLAPEQADPPPAEVVFVLDCSGSMAGESLRQATAALELCLRSLSEGDTFNVCRFGSTFELMRPEPVVYAQATLNDAIEYVRRSADLGGTELYPPLEAILRVPPRAGTVRQIVLLTDGQVSNEPAVVALARKHRARNRIFSFGIGSAASQFLVKGLARATGGAAEFITGTERIEDKVLRTFARMASPMVSDVAIDWGDTDVQTLAEIPPVFDGDALAVFGRALGKPPAAVTLSCSTPAGPRQWTIPVPREVTDDGGTIATSWARRAIQSLEEVSGVRRSASTGSEASPGRERDRLIGLSKEFNLVCSLTSFVAVEHRSVEERNVGRPALRRVPVQLAQGWGGALLGELAAASAVRYCCKVAAIDKTMDQTIDRLRDSRDVARPKKSRRLGWSIFGRGRKSMPDQHAPRPQHASPPPAPTPRGPLHLLLGAQSAEGWFEWGDELEHLLRTECGPPTACRETVEQALAELDARSDGSADVARVVATVLALWLLRHRFAADARIWDRAAAKARRWLAAEMGRHTYDVNPWLERVDVHLPRA
jgi:Ca-activated chloride channel family protein